MWPSKSRRQTVDCESQVEIAMGPSFSDEEEEADEGDEDDDEQEKEEEGEEEEEEEARAGGCSIRSSWFWPLEWRQVTAGMRLAAE